MTEIATRLQGELSLLSVEDRAEMAYSLIQSLDSGADSDVEAAWDSELARRVSEVSGGIAIGEASEAVFQRVRGNIV